MLSTDKQTDRQTNQRYQKHNLLCQGGNKMEIHICCNSQALAQYKHQGQS